MSRRHSPANIHMVVASAVVIAATAGLGAAQAPRAVFHTPLEAVALEPGARTMWSKFVGRLDGRTASAIVTAVAVRPASAPPTLMRGVRIELRHEGPRPDCDLRFVEWATLCARENAAAYVEEERLDRFRADVLRGNAQLHPGHPSGVTTFWSSSHGGGILIGGYQLFDRRLEDLVALLDAASAELKTAPRQTLAAAQLRLDTGCAR
jgi:hypothetical protein